jgi:hypothetical protein
VIESRMMEAYCVGVSSQAKCPASMITRRAGGQPLVEKLRVGERDYAVVAAVDDRDRRRDLGQQPGQHGQFLGVSAGIAHRLGKAVAVVAGQVVRADVVGYPACDGVQRRADDHPPTFCTAPIPR